MPKNDENYNDEVEEKIENKKELPTTFETNKNNLNEVFLKKVEESTIVSKTPQNKLSALFDKEIKKENIAIKNISTRQSTESNDSLIETQKFFTPTHNNSSNKCYDILQVQREIDFTKQNNSKLNNYYNNNKSLSFVNRTSNIIRYTDKKEKDIFDHKIVLENIIMQKDKRTTLMLRNIPNKYTLHNLVDEINNHNPSFAGKFDFINLPIDFEVFILLIVA